MEDIINTQGIPIIQSTRAMSGEVPSSGIESETAIHIASGYLNPYKSRILLGVLLANRKNITEVKEVFSGATGA